MSNVLVITGSPSPTSKTERVGEYVARRISSSGWSTDQLRLRTLPAAALLSADTGHPQIADAVAQVAEARGIVLATPTYKAAYSGLLKTFLDLLPQYAFAGKAVLPLATGGTTAHVLALDYGLRPVVHSLGARHVVQSFFLLDKHLSIEDGNVVIDPASASPLDDVLEQFHKALHGVPHDTVLGRSA
ncbi:NADPH-dependent FMN reductase [Saccharopolyspora rectivirgula]|uniref:NADPH-dependent FMN reductase n=1 Tax=Saccharopolyspora rectivirgula TaxID=28042 RepID=A0A073B3C7_9PSEU|nr:NADPH-dependent FMN reductase [Saccharopolyspora rectivirgula]KEI45752.1 NADPH-dependent FMN reductase [Saccharopolyspora rectivirgula]